MRFIEILVNSMGGIFDNTRPAPLYPGKAGKSSFWMRNSWFCWASGTPKPCFLKEPRNTTTRVREHDMKWKYFFENFFYIMYTNFKRFSAKLTTELSLSATSRTRTACQLREIIIDVKKWTVVGVITEHHIVNWLKMVLRKLAATSMVGIPQHRHDLRSCTIQILQSDFNYIYTQKLLLYCMFTYIIL